MTQTISAIKECIKGQLNHNTIQATLIAFKITHVIDTLIDIKINNINFVLCTHVHLTSTNLLVTFYSH